MTDIQSVTLIKNKNHHVDHEDKLAQLDRLSLNLLNLADELCCEMHQNIVDDFTVFDRGARALSSLLRANQLIGVLKEQTAREINDENARPSEDGSSIHPENYAELERIRFESARHLYAHTVQDEDPAVASAREE